MCHVWTRALLGESVPGLRGAGGELIKRPQPRLLQSISFGASCPSDCAEGGTSSDYETSCQRPLRLTRTACASKRKQPQPPERQFDRSAHVYRSPEHDVRSCCTRWSRRPQPWRCSSIRRVRRIGSSCLTSRPPPRSTARSHSDRQHRCQGDVFLTSQRERLVLSNDTPYDSQRLRLARVRHGRRTATERTCRTKVSALAIPEYEPSTARLNYPRHAPERPGASFLDQDFAPQHLGQAAPL